MNRRNRLRDRAAHVEIKALGIGPDEERGTRRARSRCLALALAAALGSGCGGEALDAQDNAFAADGSALEAQSNSDSELMRLGSAEQALTADGETRLGYNLDYPGDWTNMPPFIDQMKNARAVRGECGASDPSCDPVRHLDLDTTGWPRSLRYRDDAGRSYAAASVIVNTSSERVDIGRDFVLTWQGQGDVDVFPATGARKDAANRRIDFKLARGNTTVRVTRTDPDQRGDYVRNVRLFRADHAALLNAGEIFNPDMLAYLRPFGGLRFMDWMQSNAYGRCAGGTRNGQSCYSVINEDCGGGSCKMPGKWSERPTQDQASFISWGQYLDNRAPELGTRLGGYPLEVMLALANRLSADPHFNMPAAYDDDYVRRFATYVRDNLAPALTARVEYSNEVWNWGFPQAQRANVLGRNLWPNEGSAWVQYAAGITHRMCKIWKEVFVGQERRVSCLISPQTGWRELAETVLECPAWVKTYPGDGPCYRGADAINITGYFSGCLQRNDAAIQSWLGQGRAKAFELAFEQLTKGGLIPDCSDNLKATTDTYRFFERLGTARGLGLHVYESGTHFDYGGSSSAVGQFLVDLAHDDRMYSAYMENMVQFLGAGGDAFDAWGWVAQNDMWSNSDSLSDRVHPKYRAIKSFSSLFSSKRRR